MNKTLDVILLGRIALDFNPADFGKSFADTENFHKFVGGSAANTAVGLAKMGCKVGFFSCVSNDGLGDYVLQYMKRLGVDVSHVARADAPLGLSFVEILPDGKTNLMMHRSAQCADLQLCMDDIDEAYIASAKYLLVSGTALSASPSREAALKAIVLAKKVGTKIIFDIDYRPQVWKSKDEISLYYTMAAREAFLIMGSREEFNLTDALYMPEADDRATADRWFGERAELLIIKHGSKGSYVYCKGGKTYRVHPFKINFLKATGGGDAYSSAFVAAMLKDHPIPACAEWGTASASLAVSADNCSDALPDEATLTAFIESRHAQGETVIFEE